MGSLINFRAFVKGDTQMTLFLLGISVGMLLAGLVVFIVENKKP
jgi:hypothetical protein